VAQGTQRAIHTRNIVICDLAGPTIFFSHIISQTTLFSKTKLLNIKCVFLFPLQLMSETFLILRRIWRDIILHIHWSSYTPPFHFFFILDWSPVPHFAPWRHCNECGWRQRFIVPFPVFLIVSTLAARCLSRPQPAVVLAARGGTMGGNSGQIMPGICTQVSLTCRRSATWDR
jgi:hypothetical protein